MKTKPKLYQALTFVLLFAQLCATSAFCAQEDPYGNETLLKTIKIGPHPIYTRILVDLNKSVNYQIDANFREKRIVLILPATKSGPRVRNKVFNDKNLEQFTVSSLEEKAKVTFILKKSNTRFFHSMNPKKPQIIIDLKGEKRPIIQTKIKGQVSIAKLEKRSNTSIKKGDLKNGSFESNRGVRLAGFTPKKIRELKIKDEKEKIKNGWEEYQQALKLFQEQKFENYTIKVESKPDPETGETKEIDKIQPGASKALKEYTEKYPDSKYLGKALYLRAESEYRKTYQELNPNYDSALAAYQAAMRTDPKSKFYDHALLKVASIYDEIGYGLEARTLYNQGIKTNKKSLYNRVREESLAAMLIKEERFKEAFDALQLILKKSPRNKGAKAGIFKIANHFFDKKDYKQALKIYKTGIKRWPRELNKKPEINFRMAEIYFSQGNYEKARKHYFNLLNLNPRSENAHKALNRVGDTYMLQGSYKKALAVFDESSKKLVARLNKDGKPEVDKEKKVVLEDGPETQYGRIRMADIGIRSPRIKVNDIVFDVANYYKPFSAYEKVFQEAKNEKILAEVTLSRGIAYLLEQNYLRAIEEFKKLFPLGPDSRYSQEAEKFVKQALIALVDKYSKQNGTLPILYSYSDFVSLPITNIKNPKTLLQVGEAYQAIGMLPEAVKFYEKVKILDSEKMYRDRIFLNLGKIHLKEKNFDDAILVGRSFIKNFPRSKRLNEAKKLMALANKGNGNLLNAITIYEELIELSENAAEIHYLIAEAKTELKKYAEAAVSYQNAIAEYDRKERVIPDYIQKSYYHLGTSLYKINKFKAAIEAFNSAKELFPENPLKDWADYLLIESYGQQKETDKSKEEINRLVDSKNADPILKRAAKSSANIQEWEKQLKEG